MGLYNQGCGDGGAEGAVLPRTSWYREPHQLISTFLFIASLDELKEPLNWSSLQGSKSASRFSPPDSLAFCPLCLLQPQTQEALFCSFAPDPQKPLGDPVYNYSHTVVA